MGNITIPLENHQEMMVDAGFRILACLHDIEETHGVSINFRVGIASGPIVGMCFVIESTFFVSLNKLPYL